MAGTGCHPEPYPLQASVTSIKLVKQKLLNKEPPIRAVSF